MKLRDRGVQTDALRPKREKGQSIGYRILAAVVSVFLWIICATYIFPFIWLSYNSLKTQGAFSLNVYDLPAHPTFFNYTNTFSGSAVYTALFNSAFNTVVSIVFIVVLSFVVAYFLARYRFRGRKFLYAFFVTGLLVPILGLLIPAYIQFHMLHMLDQRYTLLIPYITFNLPVAIYLYDSYIKTIPRSVEEAAFMDGATINQIMADVIFPICMPMTATVVILNFLFVWNEFPFALVLDQNPAYHTVTVWLSMFQGQYVGNIPGRLTAMLIATIPVIVAYFSLRERMMRGLTAGAIKG